MKRIFLIATALIISVLASTVLVSTPAAGFVNSPSAEVPEWQLTVTGFVDSPMNLIQAEMVALPQTTVYA